jgi:ABC-2 type transport system ATP-binding protein
MAPALAIRGLSKRYGAQLAVDDISLEVAPGELFGFLGPNGAGKTTTISCVTGLATPDRGEISVFGHDAVADYRAARRLVGLSPQDYNFDIFRTAWEVLTYNAGFFGLPPRRAAARAEELLGRFGLSEHRQKPVNQLSGGMKRRLTLARALVHSPRLLILDEPTAGVDLELRRFLWDELRRLRQAGTTIVLTTHYLEEAEQLCERVAIIHQGRLAVVERTDELKRQHGDKKLEDIFLALTAGDGAAAALAVTPPEEL